MDSSKLNIAKIWLKFLNSNSSKASLLVQKSKRNVHFDYHGLKYPNEFSLNIRAGPNPKYTSSGSSILFGESWKIFIHLSIHYVLVALYKI